ncbi:stage IV sporulation protein FB [Weizmannia acidilactici]|uniref:Stage IV sporulation protein FB n=1 Tax=Weizmannia acidilactici TaxID=2607726 RepID=A0A5J4J2I0_9BACI|nr:M50 family metallopeptidase [Weizmannia acidilactici]GER66197.1 stage IV sporulation protein FB [Weizmannia acidilactici]GER69166.1 stage IV sporulation protein FB [Weizmannia acidilactici]GER72137.1 stage IV sporulation protein FB [Weizmannia acidilactici]
MSDLFLVLKKIKIHPLFWIVAAIAVATARFQELVLLFAIILIHEMGHAGAAQFFSWRIKKIMILPFGGVAETEEHGNRPLKEEMAVTLAGPVQHVWIAICAYALFYFHILPESLYIQVQEWNRAILFFNLLPIWPLDGGKIANMAFSRFFPFLRAFRITIFSSLAVLLIFHATALFNTPANLNIWAVAVYLYASLWKEWKQLYFVFIRFLLERYYGNRDPLHDLETLRVDAGAYLYEVLESFKRGRKHPLIVLQGGVEIGKLDENELLHAFFSEKQTHAKVKDIMYSY